MTLFSMAVTWAGPSTWPQTSKLSRTPLTVKLAYGFPFAVGMDMSTTQWRREVMLAGTVEVEPEDGSMIWRPKWLSTVTEDTEVAANAPPFSAGSAFSSGAPNAIAGTEVGASSGRCCCLSGSPGGVDG